MKKWQNDLVSLSDTYQHLRDISQKLVKLQDTSYLVTLTIFTSPNKKKLDNKIKNIFNQK